MAQKTLAPPAAALLPLPPHVFEILLAVFEKELHGYALLEEIGRRSGGRITLGTSTMYAALKRMLRLKLIEETGPPADADSGDERRRYYRATIFGREVAKAEAERVRQLSKLITSSGVLDAPAGARGRG